MGQTFVNVKTIEMLKGSIVLKPHFEIIAEH